MKKTFKTWLLIGVFEIIFSVFLLAIAPVFLNSKRPLIGFLLWASIPVMLGGSSLYASMRVYDALKTKRLLTSKFPALHCLSLEECLQIPSARVIEKMSLLEAASTDDEFAQLNLSLMDILND